MFGKKYIRWGAVFPGNFVPVLKIEGKCSRLGSGTLSVKLAHSFDCCDLSKAFG
jgi:hypothetical protein